MRALKITVIAMGVVILVGFAIVAAELVRRAFLTAEPSTTISEASGGFTLPAGARIAAIDTLGSQIVLLLEEGEVQRLLLVDPAALPLTTGGLR